MLRRRIVLEQKEKYSIKALNTRAINEAIFIHFDIENEQFVIKRIESELMLGDRSLRNISIE